MHSKETTFLYKKTPLILLLWPRTPIKAWGRKRNKKRMWNFCLLQEELPEKRTHTKTWMREGEREKKTERDAFSLSLEGDVSSYLHNIHETWMMVKTRRLRIRVEGRVCLVLSHSFHVLLCTMIIMQSMCQAEIPLPAGDWLSILSFYRSCQRESRVRDWDLPWDTRSKVYIFTSLPHETDM